MINFDFEMVNFPFLDGDGPRSASFGVYVSQLIRFARASSHVASSTLAINCKLKNFSNGAQWLSGRVLDSDRRAAGSSLTGVTALWSLSKTHLS